MLEGILLSFMQSSYDLGFKNMEPDTPRGCLNMKMPSYHYRDPVIR